MPFCFALPFADLNTNSSYLVEIESRQGRVTVPTFFGKNGILYARMGWPEVLIDFGVLLRRHATIKKVSEKWVWKAETVLLAEPFGHREVIMGFMCYKK